MSDPVHVVLLVEDYADTREAVAMALETRGFRTTGLATAEEAMAMLRNGFHPCIILLDLRLPGMNGWEFCQALAAEPDLAGIPVVMFSGDGALDAQAKRHGLRAFLRKPADPDDLIAAVERHCGRTH